MAAERPLRVEIHENRCLVQYPTHWKFDCELCDFIAPFLSEAEARAMLRDHACPEGSFPSSVSSWC